MPEIPGFDKIVKCEVEMMRERGLGVVGANGWFVCAAVTRVWDDSIER